jgi:hypothetical protein
VRFDPPGPPETALVGGTWNGAHQEGVTYARHIVDVTNGRIGFHSGIPGGGMVNPGAAFNGVQLRLLATVPAFGAWHFGLLIAATALIGAVLQRRRG